jgi:hypothetical protein
MNSGSIRRHLGLALVLTFAAVAASAQSGIGSAPDKTRGATPTPDLGVATVSGPSTISVSPKKSNKAAKPVKKAKKARAASAAASM